MSLFSSKSTDLAIPLKPLLQRIFVAALVGLSVLLLFLERSNNGLSASIRMAITDGVVPVIDVMSAPMDAINSATTAIDDVMLVYQENARLREENRRLLHWQHAARALEVENNSLRELMHYHPQHAISYITAQVVGDTTSGLNQQILIAAGENQGVKLYQAVINENGLLGRVINVGKDSSQVMLISDINSRIPVAGQQTGLKTILAGDRSAQPYLRFKHAKKMPKAGELIVTTGDGDVFPPGLVVGKVQEQDGGAWRVSPNVDLEALHYVRVVSFSKKAQPHSVTLKP
ncbi:MAG: rod shape-determining protein MreC [Rickettsiales bacterium]|nr:rod shape-determining protein MreC [Rickettsiales bacterium]